MGEEKSRCGYQVSSAATVLVFEDRGVARGSEIEVTYLALQKAADLFGGRGAEHPMHPRTIVRLLYGESAPYRPAHDAYKITFEELAVAVKCDKNLLLRVAHGQDSFHTAIDAAVMLELTDRTFKRYRQKGLIEPTLKARGIVRYSRRYLVRLHANHPWMNPQ